MELHAVAGAGVGAGAVDGDGDGDECAHSHIGRSLEFEHVAKIQYIYKYTQKRASRKMKHNNYTNALAIALNWLRNRPQSKSVS